MYIVHEFVMYLVLAKLCGLYSQLFSLCNEKYAFTEKCPYPSCEKSLEISRGRGSKEKRLKEKSEVEVEFPEGVGRVTQNQKKPSMGEVGIFPGTTKKFQW